MKIPSVNPNVNLPEIYKLNNYNVNTKNNEVDFFCYDNNKLEPIKLTSPKNSQISKVDLKEATGRTQLLY